MTVRCKQHTTINNLINVIVSSYNAPWPERIVHTITIIIIIIVIIVVIIIISGRISCHHRCYFDGLLFFINNTAD